MHKHTRKHMKKHMHKVLHHTDALKCEYLLIIAHGANKTRMICKHAHRMNTPHIHKTCTCTCTCTNACAGTCKSTCTKKARVTTYRCLEMRVSPHDAPNEERERCFARCAYKHANTCTYTHNMHMYVSPYRCLEMRVLLMMCP